MKVEVIYEQLFDMYKAMPQLLALQPSLRRTARNVLEVEFNDVPLMLDFVAAVGNKNVEQVLIKY